MNISKRFAASQQEGCGFKSHGVHVSVRVLPLFVWILSKHSCIFQRCGDWAFQNVVLGVSSSVPFLNVAGMDSTPLDTISTNSVTHRSLDRLWCKVTRCK